jgi:acetyltransferase-like isoleucine patch superfamily enzyme
MANVGRNCIVGAGSVVTRTVPDNTTVVGNPAKSIAPRRVATTG